MIDDYQGKQATVMGLGRFGGGVGVTRFLAERGADVWVTDTLSAEELKDSVAQLADLEKTGRVRYRLGEHNVSDFTTGDLVVVNPAVKPDNRFVRAARAAGVPITSEIRLLVKHLPNRLRTIGVTGSAGKSTTTAMIHHILKKVLPGGSLSDSRAMGAVSDSPPLREGPGAGPGAERPQAPGDLPPAAPSPQPPPPREGGQEDRRGPGVWMGGNIGGSLLPYVEQIQHDDWVVLELSSFMLEGLREDRWSPHIAVVTNISPNHLDWHGSVEQYVAAKRSIMEFQGSDDSVVFGPEDQFASMMETSRLTRSVAEPEGRGFFQLSIPGKHNQVNALIANAAFDAAKFAWESVDQWANCLSDFFGLPHRLEYVGEVSGVGGGGVRCYNDSKSTTPEAAGLAIEAFDPGTVRVILGGYDKGSDFGELAKLAAGRCAGVYTIGATGEGIADLVAGEMGERKPDASAASASACGVVRCGTLAVAVGRAMGDANEGEVLLLSPGCASWDQFANYEERGARFVALVKGLEAS